jgi:N6-adenosine-specific RNA methylase IME4
MAVWEKTYGRSAGMPLYGFRWNAEFILIGYKNKPQLFPKRKLIPLVFQAENIKHSKKPDKFYKMVEVLGDKRIDLFARNEREGWDVWGNEVNG